MPYTMPSIPQRTGYTFEGLFDAEVGGTQYVSANGSSVSVFSDKKNMVLFPHFKAKTYSIILDYQEAEVTGGVCGYARNCTFRNCSNSATIFSGGRYVPAAGISAGNVNSNYINCSNSGGISVSQGSWVGIGGAWTQKGDIYCTRL